MKPFLFLLLIPVSIFAQRSTESYVRQTQIIRDHWGIAHVYGKTDADAVFGMVYAQCEDDFTRIELNYIEKLGRLAEINGEKSIYNDLQIRLLIDSADAIADYQKAEPWFKKLLDAHSAAINYYLRKNPEVKPQLLTKFQPWYALLWTDGSIGAINTADLTLTELKNFYIEDSSKKAALKPIFKDQFSGSNGFAFAPKITKNGNAILYINPHTSFYFRPEIQMQSDEGLNAYGAVTWGQFFIYQGFNEFCGWMHTSNNVDIADAYIEKIDKKDGKLYYEYDGKQLPVKTKSIAIKWKEGHITQSKKFIGYFTNKGPVLAERDGKWISLRHENRSAKSLIQSWVRTKSKSFTEYQKAMDLCANASNNTVYADAAGNIAYWHGNFIPKRNPEYNWAKPVDGSISKTAWQGLHSVKESVHIYNPSNGWLQNCNSTPFSTAGTNSPKKANYPFYMAPDGENFRGITATTLLSKPNIYDIDKVIATGYNTFLPAFEILVPALIKRYNEIAQSDSLKAVLAEPITILKNWDFHSSSNSIATTLAFEWAPRLNASIRKIYIEQGEKDQVENTKLFAAQAKSDEMLIPLKQTIDDLTKRFGTWQKAWGDINRFQRLTGNIIEKYDDKLSSLPVAFGHGAWGQLPSFVSATSETNNRYGYNGNSFVCSVEFGKRIKAKSILAGGNSGNPQSKHFNDQAEMFTKGQFKDVLFYKEDVLKNVERQYRPGE